MVEINYYSKYLKYKQKYLKQKNLQIGGNDKVLINTNHESYFDVTISSNISILEALKNWAELNNLELEKNPNLIIYIHNKTKNTIQMYIIEDTSFTYEQILSEKKNYTKNRTNRYNIYNFRI